ncbi:MAG: HIRAN domain-containing protein [Promethearchaeota archaeon]
MSNFQDKDLKKNSYYHMQIVGIYYTKNGKYLSKLPTKTLLELRAEPNNRYDKYAVSVWHNEKKLGYLPRNQNKSFFTALTSNTLTLSCLLGSYIPSSEKKNYSRGFQPERANITIHTYKNEIDWRPVSLIPEDTMAF